MAERNSELLKVDIGSVETPHALHILLAAAFRFPVYYGRNWDAFDECLRDVELPTHVEIAGIGALRARLPREAELLEQCVADFVSETGHRIVIRSI